MRKIISIILLIVSPSGIFGAPYFTSIRTIANVHKAIELLINDGDFEYFARLSSKNGIGINRVTSNRQEKEYFFSYKNELYDSTRNISYQDGFWGRYNFSKERLANIAAHKKKYPNDPHYNLNNVDYQAIEIFESYWKTTYKSPIYGKYKIRYATYPDPFIKGKSNKFLEVSFREAAGGDTASFLFIKEAGFFRLRYY